MPEVFYCEGKGLGFVNSMDDPVSVPDIEILHGEYVRRVVELLPREDKRCNAVSSHDPACGSAECFQLYGIGLLYYYQHVDVGDFLDETPAYVTSVEHDGEQVFTEAAFQKILEGLYKSILTGIRFP